MTVGGAGFEDSGNGGTEFALGSGEAIRDSPFEGASI
jgi:hypothetical protein